MALCHLTGRLELPTWSDREGGVEAELRTSSSCRLKESEYQDVSLESAGRLIPPLGAPYLDYGCCHKATQDRGTRCE